MKKITLAALLSAIFSYPVGAQTYTQIPFGVNKGVTPYNVGTLLNNVWYNFATLSAGGMFVVNSTSGGAGTVSGVMAANGAGVVSGVSGTSGHTVPWLDGTNTWSAQQTFSAAPVLPLTTGSIPFIGAGGVLSQDNANLFWDDTNNKLGVGTITPQAQTQIVNLNYAPTDTNFLGQPSGVLNGVGNGAQTIYFKRTGGVGQYGYNLTLVEVEAESTGEPWNRRSDHALTAWINAHNKMSGGRLNGLWIGANSPATARGEEFLAGGVSGAEIDYGNLSADFGIRINLGGNPNILGLMIGPDPTPSTRGAPWADADVTIGSPAIFHKTAHGMAPSMGIKFRGAAAVAAGLVEGTIYYIITSGMTADEFEISTTREGPALSLAGTLPPREPGDFQILPSWPGTWGLVMAGSVHGHQTGTQIHIQQDSVRPKGYGIFARGSTVVSSLTAPAAILQGWDHWSRGVDFVGASFDSDAIRLADDQIMRFGSATIKGIGAGSLIVSTLGTGTTGRLLANGGAQEVISWGANSTPAPILSFYGAAPVTKPTVTGSCASNAACASIASALATLGLITDSTTP